MANLKNSLVASFVYFSVVAVLYGFTASVGYGTGKYTQDHWGSGAIGRPSTDVMSTTSSLSGGSARHATFGAYREGKTTGVKITMKGGSEGQGGAYSDVTGSGH